MLGLQQRQRRRKKSSHRRTPGKGLAIIAVLILCFAYFYFSFQFLLRHGSEHSSTATKPAAQPLEQIQNDTKPDVSYQVQAFYYPWYCNPGTDGEFMHWNHPLLPHWDAKIAKQYPAARHDPTRNDLGSSFYPQLGPYSSADESVIRQHMKYLIQAGIGVAVVSWLPKNQHDDNGPPVADRLGQLLRIASEYSIQIAIHLEPYATRTPESVGKDIQDILQEHGTSPAIYRLARPGHHNKKLPLFYVYDQYRTPGEKWKALLSDDDDDDDDDDEMNSNNAMLRGGTRRSIRGTQYDAVVLALIVERKHWRDYVEIANFDGGYTYFAANTFTYGSTPRHWRQLQERALSVNKLFVPSVGPGYDDTRIRPWNAENTKERQGGAYFGKEWEAAIASGAHIITITSFNEWHEGTQIEPAASDQTTTDGEYRYKDYKLEGGPMAYLDINKKWKLRFQAATT